MKPIGIVFLLVNLALVAAFLGYAKHSYDTNIDWKTKHDEVLASKTQTEETLNAQIATLRSEKNELSDSRDGFREERDRLQAQANDLTAQLQAMTSRADDLNSQVAGINASLNDFRRDIETANAQKDEAQEARVAAERERDEAKDAAQAATLAQRDAQDAQRRLQQQLDDTELALAERTSSLDQLQVKFDVLMEITGANIDDVLAQPLIAATVVDVSHDINPGLVVLNVGSSNS
jgi:chromosome segregation ATPase